MLLGERIYESYIPPMRCARRLSRLLSTRAGYTATNQASYSTRMVGGAHGVRDVRQTSTAITHVVAVVPRVLYVCSLVFQRGSLVSRFAQLVSDPFIKSPPTTMVRQRLACGLLGGCLQDIAHRTSFVAYAPSRLTSRDQSQSSRACRHARRSIKLCVSGRISHRWRWRDGVEGRR